MLKRWLIRLVDFRVIDGTHSVLSVKERDWTYWQYI